MSSTIAPEKILRELAEMWTELAASANGDDGALRACSLTLVTLAEENEDFSALGETLAALIPEYPARNLVVRLTGAGERSLSERVYSQCWMPFGQKRKVCCEQVEITASDTALADLPSVILPLTVADLPVILWCRSPRIVGMPEFGAIAAMASRVILDGDALGHIPNPAPGGTRIGDLAWTRLTPWRATLSQIFENRQQLAELPHVSRVIITTAGAPSTRAWYFAAWVLNALADAGVTPEFQMQSQAGAAPGMKSIELEAGEASVKLECHDQRLITTAGGMSQCNPLRPPTDYALMREELRIVGPDAVFERTLATARRLAGASK